MMLSTPKRVFSLTLLFLFLTNGFNIVVNGEPIPTWMRPGVQLEYMGKVSEIMLYDKSAIPASLLAISRNVTDNDSGLTVLSLKEHTDVYLLILVENLNNSHLLLKVTLKIGTYSSKKDLLVELSTRNVSLINGTLLGQTTLWIPPCKVGDRIRFVGEGNSTVFAKVYESHHLDTVQGIQDVLSPFLDVEGSHEVSFYSGMILTPLEAQSIKYFHPRINRYDADTFILIEGNLDEDALLSAFNIVSFILMEERFKLLSTNIDLGPQNLLVTLLRSIPHIILVATIIVTIIYFVFIRKRKARKYQ